ncbi:hypothetical protein [Zooshikella sp. RANM57]|uniref:hypothetical protein n=1 Tax=Zooshikella sp. RANM57 TaxID=3425863 RepID=UPI003D6F1FEF
MIMKELQEDNSENNVKIYIESLIQAVLVPYRFHPNRTTSLAAVRYKKLFELSSLYCGDSKLEDFDTEFPDIEEFSILPNSHGKMMAQASGGIFIDYIFERCLTHTYLDGTVVSFAVKQYIKENNKAPEKLQDLVPRFLDNVPIDVFDGKQLKYSKENMWIYSVGYNLEDNGGSRESYIDIPTCYNVKKCYNNPTIPVNTEYLDN